MKFKKFKKKEEGRSMNEERSKLEEKYKDFLTEIKDLKLEIDYEEWKEAALFVLFLRPETDLVLLRPESIEKYYEEVVFKR